MRGARVKADSPAKRGRSGATRLDAGEHTRTLAGLTMPLAAPNGETRPTDRRDRRTDGPTWERGCLGLPVRIAYGTSNDGPKHPYKLLKASQLRYFASGCGRNWNFTRIGFETDRYSPFSTARPSSACHTVSEPVDE